MENEENFRVFEGMDDLVKELTGQESRQKDNERKIAEEIEARYVEFDAGSESRKILCKGDFKYALDPWELVLPGGENEINIPYKKVINAVFRIVGDDIVSHNARGDTIQKPADEETRILNLYRQRNPNAVFTVNIAYYKLKSPPEEERVLQFETYFPDQLTQFPLSLIVLAKRRDITDPKGGNNTNRYRLQPRSMVRTENVPLLPARTKE